MSVLMKFLNKKEKNKDFGIDYLEKTLYYINDMIKCVIV